MSDDLQRITIHNRTYGDLDGVEILVTRDLYEYLAGQQNREGIPLLTLLENGRAVQGLKHLIAAIKESSAEAEVILNTEETKRVGNCYFIKYDEYRDRAQERFFDLYKETGSSAARSYLNSYFPEEFEYDPNELRQAELTKVSRQLPYVLRRVSDRPKNKVVLLEEATKSVPQLKYRDRASKKALLDLQRQSTVSLYEARLQELRSRLTKDYQETRGRNSWQRWIYENRWLFGVRYLDPIEKTKVGFDSIPDFLFPTVTGFLDILEIKKPSFAVLVDDPSHPGSYSWCSQTNRAIGQVVNYIQNMELNQLLLRQQIEEKYGSKYETAIYPLKPRAFVLVGAEDDWTPAKKKALRLMNYSMHGIEVITYTDLIKRGESIVSVLRGEQAS